MTDDLWIEHSQKLELLNVALALHGFWCDLKWYRIGIMFD